MTNKEVMQMALDALQDAKASYWTQKLQNTIEALRTALAQPKPEPVAWMYKGEPWFDGKLWNEKIEVTKDKLVAMFKDQNAKPLYATPPKREWVGLTDEEIAEAIGAEPDDIYLADFRKVEAKLKEKNT